MRSITLVVAFCLGVATDARRVQTPKDTSYTLPESELKQDEHVEDSETMEEILEFTQWLQSHRPVEEGLAKSLSSVLLALNTPGAAATLRARSVAANAAMDELPRRSLPTEMVATLDSPVAADPLADYVKEHGGSRVIRKVLIANNGMAATKSILSMKQWAYMNFGDSKAIQFVAMATPEDLQANAEFIRLADSYVEVPGGSNKNNYANVDLIVNIAEQQGVDGVWPGWGHASENPKLPDGLNSRGIKFIGPTGSVMSVLGDKIAANILAQTAKVPSIPWSGDGLVAELTDDGRIPDETFNKAMVTTVEECITAAERIGFPVMLKASEGGGGKGIRMSNSVEELRTNFVQVQNEVPGSPMFMMQLCTKARHLEVQVVGDEHGNAVALNGRDCSTQRRFQKIFEEGPPSICPRATFREMEKAAQRLVQSIGYIGAGTVEYLYNAETDDYYFLELNPRLQVEHPVTEGITGVNLPSLQLQVAMGIPLDRTPDIRKFYGKEDVNAPGGDIDFLEDDYKKVNNHVIAARITAENPDEGFKPTSGSVDRVKFQPTPSVWGYFSVGANGGIHEFADSQFGHLFATGPNREEARKSLVLALENVEVRGDIRTTVEYLVELLETPDFKDNTIDTSWLDGIIRDKSVVVQDNLNTEEIVVGAILARAYARIKSEEEAFLTSLGKGQVSLQPLLTMSSFPMELTFADMKYNFKVTRTSSSTMRLEMNGGAIDVTIQERPDGSLLTNFGDKQRRLIAIEEPLGLRMSLDGTTVLLPTVFDPSEFRTDVTGKVVRYLFEDGQEVEAGQAYVEVEAMKMIMPLKATETGRISNSLSPGSVVSAGDMLSSIELKDPSKAKKILPFEGQFALGKLTDTEMPGFEKTVERLLNVFSGFADDYDALVKNLLNAPDGKAEVEAITALLNRYDLVESSFATAANRDEAVGELIKANKDSLATVLDLGRSHVAGKETTKLAALLLRQLSTLPDRFGEGLLTEELNAVLTKLAAYAGKSYGEMALLASEAKEQLSTSPFETRIARLRENLLSETDRNKLARSPDISGGMDLLISLFADEDEKVRAAAFEVYIRRVYRAHNIIDLNVDTTAGTVTWTSRLRITPLAVSPLRYGYMKVVPSLDGIDAAAVSTALSDISSRDKENTEMVNVMHFVCTSEADSSKAIALESLFAGVSGDLQKSHVRYTNVLVPRGAGVRPQFFSFNECDGYKEDELRRDMRPTMSQLLELRRLNDNFDLQRLDDTGLVDRGSQVYLGIEKGVKGRRPAPQAVFMRSISDSTDVLSEKGAEKQLLLGFDRLRKALLDPRVAGTASSRFFVNVMPDVKMTPEEVQATWQKTMSTLITRYASQLIELKVDEIEVKVRIPGEDGQVTCLRLVASSMAGEWLKVDAYVQNHDPVSGGATEFCGIGDDAETCLLEPYRASDGIQVKRAAARRIGTTYAYDFLGLFERGLIRQWLEHKEVVGEDAVPSDYFESEELVLKDGKLEPSGRTIGTNDIGMLAWHCTMKTPQYPDGREMVLIANDVTFQSGSFGVKEDDFFAAASTYAREKGIPRIYLSSNSGARIGLVEELKPLIQVAWKDEANPSQGFDYLYLTPEDYNSLPEGSVIAHEEKGGSHMAIDAVVGQVHGIGVENLRGSGMIAGETSRAYTETFTLSYVSGRSVGIGAYLMRLGQRTIQMRNGPMLLTGFSALNKLLGNEVYTSQDQLGGPQIMYPNGVSHLLAKDDEDGVAKILKWLSYVPSDMASMPSRTPVADSPERDIEFKPTKTAYDPRDMLGGATSADGSFSPGFFDAGSFTETLAGWGKSVVTGRATLGGIPMGVVAVETRAMEQRVPADPADPESREAVRMQAGQVWYPDSAFKTAQAIKDFKGERLPVMVFANWRGFSGGTRDMYDAVLKFGAMIVDALREHDMPVFVYIPPNGELRGGAWVVIDPTINPRRMEMYADTEARGGILEPPGIVEVKFRAPDQKKVMHRTDKKLQQLDAELDTALDEDSDALRAEIADREKTLLPYYGQVAVEFADLHDRAGRMVAKGVIRDAVEWPKARSYFHWRLRRRLAEDALLDRVAKLAGSDAPVGKLTARLAELRAAAGISEDDKSVATWLEGAGAADAEAATKEIAKAVVQERISALQASLDSV